MCIHHDINVKIDAPEEDHNIESVVSHFSYFLPHCHCILSRAEMRINSFPVPNVARGKHKYWKNSRQLPHNMSDPLLILRLSLELATILREDFTITDWDGEAPTRAFFWLKAPNSAFIFETLLRHYAKQAPKQSRDVKLTLQR